MDILIIDIFNDNIDDVNYNEDNPETIISVRLLAWYSKWSMS